MEKNSLDIQEVEGSHSPLKRPEASRRNVQEDALRYIFGNSSIFRTPGLKHNRPDLCSELLIKNKINDHYEAGVAAMSQSRFTRAVICFSKALILQPNQSQVFVDMAEAYLQLSDFQSAALSYRQACVLEPHAAAFFRRLAFIYYLQGQCLFDQGMFLDALKSFTKAAELKPSFRPYHIRSLACLGALGRYTDCLHLVNVWLETDSRSADLFTLRARLHHQLRQVTHCYYDLKSALKLNPSCPEALALLRQLEETAEWLSQQAIDKAIEGELSDALAKISTSLEYNPANVHFYLFRGALYRRLKDFAAVFEDLILAVELSETKEKQSQGTVGDQDSVELHKEAQTQLMLTYNDFAVHCFSCGLYSEAVKLLSKAIHEDREESKLFINRGDCFFKLGDWDFALADYQQAEEMDPQNCAIWARLAVIYNTLGLQNYEDRKYQDAADKFSLAIKYNPGVSQYYENRAKAHHNLSNFEAAKQDAIRTLVLDPTNDEVVPLLLSVFPGCSLSNIMSSDYGQTIQTQLMDSIQACKQKGRTLPRLTNGDERLPLPQDCDSQSAGDHVICSKSESESKLKPHVAQQGLHRQPPEAKQQVNCAAKMIRNQQRSVRYAGPCLVPPENAVLGRKEQPCAWEEFGGFEFNG